MKKEMYDTIDGRVLRSFEVVKKVGQGAYGQVWKARNKRTGAMCALKKIYEAFRNPCDAQKAYREIRYLQKLEHPGVVRLLAVHRPAASRDVYLELEFMEADLCVALKNSVLREIHKHYIFYQLANAVSYLHAAELVHRDIKPSNILVNETCEVKLCDFGLVRSLAHPPLTENVATRWYRAPEILLCSSTYGKPVDVWSMGCVLAEMVLQRPIFQGSSTLSQLERIFEVTGKPLPADLDYLRNKSSLAVLENLELRERRSLRELLSAADPLAVDLLERIFQLDPRKRPSAGEVLAHPFIAKFRGKVEEKLPEGPISILYEVKQLNIEDYKKLIFGEVDEQDLKVSEPAPNAEEMIYKTMPNDLGRKNVIGNYPWGTLERKSPLHSSNLSQKNLSPFAFRPRREEKEEEASKSKERKRERHSPSFLQNRKKEGTTPAKPSHDKPAPSLAENDLIKAAPSGEGGKLVKKWTFPLAYRSQSPEKKEPHPKTPPLLISKVSSSLNLAKSNPEKADNDSKLQTIYELKHSEQFYHETAESFEFKRHNTSELSKSKEKKGAPKFLLQNDRKPRDITPNKQKVERPNPAAQRSPIKSPSPFAKGLLQQSISFKSNRISPNSIQAKPVLAPLVASFGKTTK